MDNNQNGGVDRLMWPFRPIAQLIAIMSHNSEPGTSFEIHLSMCGPRAGLAAVARRCLCPQQLPGDPASPAR
jgi:hypothetical protein